MKGLERALPAFAAGCAAFYAAAFVFNWPAFTYFPAVNLWQWGWAAESDEVGPPMHWYGWIAYSALTGLGAGALSLLLPAQITEKAWAVLAWFVPVAAMAYLIYAERNFFFF